MNALGGLVNPLWQLGASVRSVASFPGDIIHVHTPSTLGLFGARLARRAKRRYVVTVRREIVQWNRIPPLRRLAMLHGLRRADVIIAPSKVIAKGVTDITGRQPLVIPNGTTHLFDEPPPADNPRNPQRILFVGTLDGNKGVHLVINAARQLRAEGTPVELVIAGDGPLRYKVMEAARLDPWITYLGTVSQEAIRENMRHAQVLCVPSYWETFGIVYAEAMKQGAVVVARKGTGIDGMGVNGTHYVLIERDSDLPGNLAILLNDPVRCAAIAAAAGSLAKAWSWSTAADSHHAVYQDLCSC